MDRPGQRPEQSSSHGGGVHALEAWVALPELPAALPPPKWKTTRILAVPLMSWVVMPRITRLLRRWLYPWAGSSAW